MILFNIYGIYDIIQYIIIFYNIYFYIKNEASKAKLNHNLRHLDINKTFVNRIFNIHGNDHIIFVYQKALIRTFQTNYLDYKITFFNCTQKPVLNIRFLISVYKLLKKNTTKRLDFESYPSIHFRFYFYF